MKTVYLKVRVTDDAVITSVNYSPENMMNFTGLYTTDFEIQSVVKELNNEEIKQLPLKSWRDLGKRKRYESHENI